MLGATQQIHFNLNIKIIQGDFIMGWRTIIISQHAKLSYASRSLIVQTIDGISQIPLDDIGLLLVSTTQAVITSALISEMSKRQIKTIFTDNEHEPVCETVDYYPFNRDVDLIKQQFDWEDQQKQILWTKIVASKITNQMKVLYIYNLPTESIESELNKLEVNDKTNREAVVARQYFPFLFQDDNFGRRNFNPINAALNYGYSILLSTINREIVSDGYLTYLGIHHHSNGNQFNLGSDFMEPFRPVIDYWVANQKITELTTDIKYALADLLNLEIIFNDKSMLLRNALTQHVDNCLHFLNGDIEQIDIKVELKNEVPNNAVNGHV